MVDETCKECGASDWNKVLEDTYPERRRDRDQTTKQIFVCEECGSEGRRFEDGVDAVVTLSGAMR